MKYIKEHKLTTFVIVVFILFVIGGYVVMNYFDIGNNLPVYGDRLDGIDKVKITDEQTKKIKDSLLEQTNVLDTNINLRGKIYNVVILVGDNAPINDVKGYANIVRDSLTEDQNKYFDLQVFIYKKYNCTLIASGKTDEEGNFTENVTVKFEDDLKEEKFALNYGISNTETKDYNKKQEYTIKEDGEFVIYGFTQDKLGESTCSIKIVKKAASEGATLKDTSISSSTSENFPIIGYKRKETNDFIWTKDR